MNELQFSATPSVLQVAQVASSLAYAVAFAALGGAILAYLLGLIPTAWTLAARDSAYKRAEFSIDMFTVATAIGVFALVIGGVS